jgi:hypothetical protein
LFQLWALKAEALDGDYEDGDESQCDYEDDYDYDYDYEDEDEDDGGGGGGNLAEAAAGVVRRVADEVGERVGTKAKLLVELLGVLGEKVDPTGVEFRMVENGLQHPFAQAVPAMFRGDDDVAKVSNGRPVRDDAGKADLLTAMKQAKIQGMAEGFFDDFPGAICRPVGPLQQSGHGVQIEGGGLIGQDILGVFRTHDAHSAQGDAR